jgi:hypothetical protein
MHSNFGDCSALAEWLAHQDAAIFCLGAYTGAVSEAELGTITVDYTVEFAHVLHQSSPNARLFPSQVIQADDLARVMVDVAVRRTKERRASMFENDDIRAMVKWLRHLTG